MYVNGGMIPTFLLFKGLHLTNSFWVYVIPGMISAFNMLVARTEVGVTVPAAFFIASALFP